MHKIQINGSDKDAHKRNVLTTVHTCSHAFVFEALLMTGLACYMGLFNVIWTTVVLCTCLYMCSLWSLATGAAVFNVVFTVSVLYGFVF